MNDSGKNQILVVDDEQNVRDSLALILKAAGYVVSTATDRFDALLQMRRRSQTSSSLT
jgi:DNA-binding response OmpR family regulator